MPSRRADPPPAPGLRGRRRGLVAAGAAVAALGLGGWWVLTGPPVEIATVRVAGYQGPDRAAVDAVVRGVAATGTVVRPPVRRMREELVARFPDIAAVSVARDWPRGLAVDVRMARPAAVLRVDRGPALLVSPSGRIMGPAPRAADLPTILARRAPDADRLAGTGQRAALAFLARLSPEVAVRLRELRAVRGGVTGRMLEGPELRLGPATRLAEKAQALDAIVDFANPAELRRATYLDLSVPERPTLGGVGSTARPPDADPDA